MIRIQQSGQETQDPSDEKKKARMAVLGNFGTFIFLVGLIKLTPYAIEQMK